METDFPGTLAPHREVSIWRRTLIARRLAKQMTAAKSLAAKVALTSGRSKFKSNQMVSEIVGLLTEVQRLQPRYVCEIGSDRGGTLALLSQVSADDAVIFSVDPMHQLSKTIPYEGLVQKEQRLIRIAGDSHAVGTLNQLKDALGGRLLDFLFIDGDHSYAGVKQDFQMYAPLVREGGLIAFHDIVPIRSENSGVCVGGVPDFFAREIETAFETRTWISDISQEGYGIGMITWPGRFSSTSREESTSDAKVA